MHFTLAKKGGFVYAPQDERQNDLVAFTQLQNGFGADFTDKATLVSRQAHATVPKGMFQLCFRA